MGEKGLALGTGTKARLGGGVGAVNGGSATGRFSGIPMAIIAADRVE